MITKQIFVTPSVTDYKSSDVEGVGTKRTVDGKVYMWVKNGDSSGSWTVGQAVLGKPSDAGNFTKIGYTAVAAGTTPLSCLMGIAVSAVPYGQYGWIIQLGYYASVSVHRSTNTTAAIGDYCKPTASQTYLSKDVIVGTAPTQTRNVVILEAVATTDTPGGYPIKCFVQCI